MSRLIITGGARIQGSMRVCGAKNAVLPILAASFLTEKPIRLTNCPYIADVSNMLSIMGTLGCECVRTGDEIYISTANAYRHIMPQSLSQELRSSIFMIGSVISRFGKVECVYPGGCEIGKRPIDFHLKGLKALNVNVRDSGGIIFCEGGDMRGADIHLDYPSVGATENLMMAAAGAKGITTISNAACEPEIVDLQSFLRKIGVNVSGAGTPVIEINGMRETDCDIIEHCVIPDRIVAGTLLCAAAMTGGNICLTDTVPLDIAPILSKLAEAGCDIIVDKSDVILNAPERPHGISRIETCPHPGFPTDMQSQISAVCAIADGSSVIVENVFDNRFNHIPELIRMGASITQSGRAIMVQGVEELRGAEVEAYDLRGGAALVLAGLAACGETTIKCVEHIDRGYESIETTLCSLGANMTRIY